MKAALLPLIAVLLTSCASRSPTVADSMTLYSPPFLRLPAGTVLSTPEGTYRAQTDEVWHSDAEYQKRVREALRP